MKRFFSLFALLVAMVSSLYAEDYSWKEIPASATSVPEDFVQGLTKDDARTCMDNYWSAEGALYGNVPEEGGKFNVLVINFDTWNYDEVEMTWAEILENGFIYYPYSNSTAITSLQTVNRNTLRYNMQGQQMKSEAKGLIIEGNKIILRK